MKKVFLVFMGIMFIMCLAGCNEKEDNDLTKDIENIIKETYCNHINSEGVVSNLTQEDVIIKNYLGKYSDAYCVVIYGDAPVIAVPQYTITIQNKEFIFMYLPEVISVYYEEKYYSLKDVCSEGILTLNDIEKLYEHCKNEKLFLDCTLNKEKEVKIKKSFLEKYKEDLKDVSINDLALRPVYEDNDICVLFIDGGFYYVECLTYEKIEDLVIGYSSGQQLLVYKSNNLYTLSEAFKEKIISYDILKEIFNIQSQYIIENENDYKNYE